MAFLKSFKKSAAAQIAGKTIDGDLTITGDLKVEGGGSFTYDEIIEGTFYATGGAIKASSGNTDFVIDSPTGQSARLVIKSDAGGANNDWWYMIAAPDYTLSLTNYQT